MYISLALLYLYFEIIHGIIIGCQLGGITDDENLCKKLIEESVLKRYYISEPLTDITSNGIGQAEQLDSDNKILKNKIFKQSLIVDENSGIENVWNETLSLGTDTYIIKFHNKLLTKYKGTELTILFRDYMVFIQSYYNTASIYYFLRMYRKALDVIREGINFCKTVYNKRFIYDHSIDKGQSNVWSWLLIQLELDISKYDSSHKPQKMFKLSDMHQSLNGIKLSIEHKVYPSSVVMFYRRYFLEDKIDEETMKILADWAKHIYVGSIDKDIMYTKNISMCSFLVFFSFSEEYEDKLKYIVKAIQLPVLSVEDRLLNYKANLLAEQFMGICLDDSKLLIDSTYCAYCEKLKVYMEQNNVLKTTIFPKLQNVYYYNKYNQTLIDKLSKILSNVETGINERLLHVIVTAATEIVDKNSEKFKKKIKNIKKAIKIMNRYIKLLLGIKINNNETHQTDKDKLAVPIIHQVDDIEDTSDTDDIYLENNNFEKIKEKENRVPNLFIALKWLAELNGALCDSTQHYQEKSKIYIQLADMCFKYLLENNFIKDDDHLKYLKNKKDAKIILANKSFEVIAWPGGWNFSNSNTETLNQSNVFEELNSLKNSDCPYINKIELNILLYRLYIVMNIKTNIINYNENMYSYIKSAVDSVVVTAEDRARNLEAHELFSMFLMMNNSHAIEMVSKKYWSLEWIKQFAFII